MTEDCQMPMPGKEHEQLLKSVGTWNVASKFYMDPSAPPMESAATDVITAIGEFWTKSDFNCDFMGMPFQGHGQLGYMPSEQCYISTWADSMAPFMMVMKGNFSEDGKTLIMTGDGPNMATGEGTVPNRIEHRFIDAGEQHMKMFQVHGGEDVLMMELHYTRAD